MGSGTSSLRETKPDPMPAADRGRSALPMDRGHVGKVTRGQGWEELGSGKEGPGVALVNANGGRDRMIAPAYGERTARWAGQGDVCVGFIAIITEMWRIGDVILWIQYTLTRFLMAGSCSATLHVAVTIIY